MRKCSFLDCQTSTVSNKEDFCTTCQNRPERKQCDICGKPGLQADRTLSIHPNLVWGAEKGYAVAQKLRSKLPAQLQAQMNPLLPDFQLSSEEVKVIEKLKTSVVNWLASKGGKQHRIDFFQTCSVCELEITQRSEEFADQNPLILTLHSRLGKAQAEAEKIIEQAEQLLGESEWEKVLTELNEEIYGKGKENEGPPNDRQPPRENGGPTAKTCARCGKDTSNQTITYTRWESGSPTKNCCSTKCLKEVENNNQPLSNSEINRLCSEIDRLRNEIHNLQQKSNSGNSEGLTKKEKELKEKEKELEKKLKEQRKPWNQPTQNNNFPSKPLLVACGIAGGGGGVILLIMFLLVRKKSRK